MQELAWRIYQGENLVDLIKEYDSSVVMGTIANNLQKLQAYSSFITSTFHTNRDLPYRLLSLRVSDEDFNESTSLVAHWVNSVLIPILPERRTSGQIETKRPALFITGPPSTGKTTLLTALLSCVPTSRVPKKEMYWPPLDGTVLLVLDEPTIGMPNISKTELCDILSSGSGSGSWLFPRKGSPPQSLDTP